jgi:ABC-2 type transport system ATP-binding protein
VAIVLGIELIDVTSGYRKREYILKNINLKIDHNTIILGPNGSGKTTLFRTILGLTPHKKGEILIDGVNIESIHGNPGLIATNLPEVFMHTRLSIRELADLYLDILGGDFDYFMEIAYRMGAKDILDKKIHELSAGFRKIIYNAISLASKSKYILLDEPFENLDPARRVAMLKEILNSKSVNLINTHMTWMYEPFGKWEVYIMVEGRVYGPLEAARLKELRITKEKISDAILSIKLSSGVEIYLSESTGIPLSSLDTLDKLYEVLTWGL